MFQKKNAESQSHQVLTLILFCVCGLRLALSATVSVLWANQADAKPNLTSWLTAQIHMSAGSLLSAAYIVYGNYGSHSK